MGMWGGGGLFGSAPLDAAAASSPAPSGPATLSPSMGSSSPMSHSGGATPHHSMSCSIANSPVAPPAGCLAMPAAHFLHGSLMAGAGAGAGPGGGGLFAPLPQQPAGAFAAADSLFGGVGPSGILLPDPNSIWGGGGTPAGPGSGAQPHFFQPSQQVLR